MLPLSVLEAHVRLNSVVGETTEKEFMELSLFVGSVAIKQIEGDVESGLRLMSTVPCNVSSLGPDAVLAFVGSLVLEKATAEELKGMEGELKRILAEIRARPDPSRN